MRRALIAMVCFSAGMFLSIAWRMAAHGGGAAVTRTGGATRATGPATATTAAAAQTVEQRVYGRLESIEGLKAALAAPPGSATAKEMGEWAGRLSLTDAFLACDMLFKSPRTDARDVALRKSILAAAKSDPFRAYALFARLGVTDFEDDTRRRLIALMTGKSAQQAWDALAAGGRISRMDVENIAKEWGRAQGYAAATFGLALRDPVERATYLRQALTAWVGADIVSFAKWFRQQPAELGLERYVSFSSVAAGQPLTLAALDAAVALNLPVDATSLRSAFQSAWEDPALREQAPAWIARQQDQGVRDAAWAELASKYIETNRARAMELLPEIADENARRRVSSTLAAEMAKDDPRGALKFAGTLGDEDALTKAQASAMATWARHQPAESLAYAREHAADLPDDFLHSAAGDWGKASPAATLDFLGSLSAEVSGDDLLKSVASDWCKRRPDEVEAWLDTASPGRVKDAVMSEWDKPAETPKTEHSLTYRPDGVTDIWHGEPGKRSTSTTINGRTVKYYY